MIKVILIPTTDEIRVGMICKSEKGNLAIIIALDTDNHYKVKYFDGKISIENQHTMPPVYVYTVNTEATINEGDYMADSIQSYFENSIQLATKESIWMNNEPKQGWYKVIATNNPNLPITQLSQENLKLIADNNGELNNFDIHYYTCDCELELKEDDKYYCVVCGNFAANKADYYYDYDNEDDFPKCNAKIANIILPTKEIKLFATKEDVYSKETIENIAFNQLYFKLSGWIHQPTFSSEELQEVWIAGYNHAKEQNLELINSSQTQTEKALKLIDELITIVSKMYSEEEVFKIAEKLCQRHDNCRKYGQLWDIEQEFKNIKK